MTPRADPVVESLKFRYGAWLDGMLGWEAGKLPDLLEDGTVYQSVLAPLLKHWYTHGARTVSRRPHFPPPLVGIMRELIRLRHQERHGLKPAAGACASHR